ncbi:MAG TPA: glycosyltransferase family 4 protein [Pyrinomonadaceae bacterium]|nr:glycosyltransferase family 4 protein [Pyrinomonadaceae bacterium]
MKQIKVLALASYPVEAAATRFRLQQFVEPLARRGITLTIVPFLDSKRFANLYSRKFLLATVFGLATSALRRLADLRFARKADVVLIQREAMIVGPPVVEWIATRVLKRPMVLDLDDATYVPYTSPTYGGLTKALKFFRKTDDLIRWSRVVICGNQTVAEYVSSKGARAEIIPTVVDTDKFKPAESRNRSIPVVGWVGTHSTFPFMQSILPALAEVAKTRPFKLKIVGSGRASVPVPGVEVENLEWDLEREVEDFQSLDVGLYPVNPDNNWATGKSGFKAIEYMAAGVPYVASPVGAAAQLGEEGVTHLFATTQEEWAEKVRTLLDDAERRQRMGAAGRRHAVELYHLETQAEKLARVLRDAAAERG